MNELPLPIWFFLLYPLCWIVLFPVLTLWSSLLYLAASRLDRNSLPPVLPRRPWLRLGVLAWVCHVGAAGCTLLLLLIPLSRFDFFFGFPGSALAALPGFCLSPLAGRPPDGVVRPPRHRTPVPVELPAAHRSLGAVPAAGHHPASAPYGLIPAGSR